MNPTFTLDFLLSFRGARSATRNLILHRYTKYSGLWRSRFLTMLRSVRNDRKVKLPEHLALLRLFTRQ